MKRESLLLRVAAPWRRARRLLILASFLAIVLLATPAWAATPCCGVTAIDARAGIATAREAATGRTFQFKVSDAKQLAKLKVGQKVYANFGTQKVSLDGRTECCPIVPATGAQGQKTGYDVKKNKKL